MNENQIEGVNNLEYNSLRSKLVLPEYGRHFQKLIDQARVIENRDERNQAAKYIIKLMGDLSPHLRDIPEFQFKLWDQLYALSDFNLDIDYPMGTPSAERVKITPTIIPYPQQKPKYRFYGNNITAMIDEAIRWEDGDKKEGLILAIANHMKKCYLNWNNNEVKDSVIFSHLKELSGGKIDLQKDSETLSSTDNLIRVTQKQSNKSDFNPNNNSQSRNFNQSTNSNTRRFVKNTPTNNNAGGASTTNNKPNHSNNKSNQNNNRKA